MGVGAYLIFALANFAILAAVLVFVSRKPLRRSVAARSAALATIHQEMSKSGQEAESKCQELSQHITNINDELEKIVSAAENTGESYGKKQLLNAEKVAEKIIVESLVRTDNEIKKIKGKACCAAVEALFLTAEKELRGKFTRETQLRFCRGQLQRLKALAQQEAAIV